MSACLLNLTVATRRFLSISQRARVARRLALVAMHRQGNRQPLFASSALTFAAAYLRAEEARARFGAAIVLRDQGSSACRIRLINRVRGFGRFRGRYLAQRKAFFLQTCKP